MYNRKRKFIFLRQVPSGGLQTANPGTPLNPHLLPYTLIGVMKQPTSYILEQYQTAMLGDISAIVLEKYHLVGK